MIENLLLPLHIIDGDTPEFATLEKRKEQFRIIINEIKTKYPASLPFLDKLYYNTNFLTDPASADNHGNYIGGLFHHSINVYRMATQLNNYLGENKLCEIQLLFVSILHDICKIDTYSIEKKFYKIEGEKDWKNYLQYFNQEDFPIGHGEKSVIMALNGGCKLSNEEQLAIRWHMGPFDASCKDYIGMMNFKKAYNSNLVKVLNMADVNTLLIEKTFDYKNKIWKNNDE